MASDAQNEANKLNAQNSTGPRTPEGKQRSSQNAVTHGLLARSLTLSDGDAKLFNSHHHNYILRFDPRDQPDTTSSKKPRTPSGRWARPG